MLEKCPRNVSYKKGKNTIKKRELNDEQQKNNKMKCF